ncbi:MAG: hypothetical protein OK455_03930, partial [Thaumarchaeota archaeon]|nr:hypothetical protein [Nitrososphaerota archaeon]
SGFSVSVPTLATGADVRGTVLITFTNDNYLTQPALITTTDSGVTLHNAGTAFVVPAGLVVTKTYATNPVFVGQNDTVTVQVVNKGTVPVFNVTVAAQSDAFDNAFSGVLHQTYGALGPNSSQSFNYTVEIFTPGNHTTSATTVAFSVGGSAQSDSFTSGNLSVYKLIQATAVTVPSVPVEGSNFLLTVSVQNPSSVNVTNVSVSIRIPQDLSIVNSSSSVAINGRTLMLSLPSLAAGASSSQSVTLRAGTDGTINLGSGTLTFQYLGATIHGVVSTTAVVVGIDLLVRYEIPIGLAVLLTIAIAIYVHRKLTGPQVK